MACCGPDAPAEWRAAIWWGTTGEDEEDAVEVIEAIRTMRSVRRFRDERVPDAVMRRILHAGRRAQSSKNSQPWQFVVVRERDTLRRLSECGDYAGHLAGSDFAVALVAPEANEFDLGQCCACLMLAAHELGVGSCIASIYDEARARMLLGIPDELRFTVALSFGYPANDWRPAKLGGRKPLEEVVRWERW
jgi:nitroreductase